MRVLPWVVFAAATGVGSGMASFKYASQLNYENAMLTLRVHQAERRLDELRGQWAAHSLADERSGKLREAKRGSHR